MGSYLHNCFISNQIIPPEAEVIIMPVMQQAGYSLVELTNSQGKIFQADQAYKSRCYPNSLWEPLGIYFPANADDSYRTFLKETSEFNNYSIVLFLEKIYTKAFNFKDEDEEINIKEKLKEVSPNLCSIFENSFKLNDLKNINFDEVINLYEEVTSMINSQQVFLSDYKGNPRQICLSVCLKSAYDYVQKQKTDSISFINHSYVSALDYIFNDEDYLQKIKDKPTLYLSSVFKFDTGSQARYDYHKFIMDVIYNEVIPDNFTKEYLHKIREKLKNIEDFIIFQFNLNELNIEFKPVHGSSQDYDNSSGINYLKMIKSISKKN